MKFITVKSKQTTASVDLVPPLVLGDKQRISLVDIRIPEQNNARRLQQVIEYKSQGEVINFEITITDKGAYLAAQENEVLFSEELAKKFNIPSRLKPYSVVKISGDEKYFVYCDLVEENNSLLSGENNAARIMPSQLLAVVPKGESGVYPELIINLKKFLFADFKTKNQELGIDIKTFQFCMTKEKQLCICAEDLWLFLIILPPAPPLLLVLPVNVL